MATVKTAVSIDADLYRRAERLAQKLHVPRSRLYSRALHEFLRRAQDRDLLRRINEAYAGGLDADEKRWLAAARTLQPGGLAEDSW
jgi:predicted transcriptional regulator